jgi:hypothetical protein
MASLGLIDEVLREDARRRRERAMTPEATA